ncbi:MAG: hypothetical protein LBJ47_02910, partial [Tannerella sp.]|nr:hypothetical protein [Tannerella sp.]
FSTERVHFAYLYVCNLLSIYPHLIHTARKTVAKIYCFFNLQYKYQKNCGAYNDKKNRTIDYKYINRPFFFVFFPFFPGKAGVGSRNDREILSSPARHEAIRAQATPDNRPGYTACARIASLRSLVTGRGVYYGLPEHICHLPTQNVIEPKWFYETRLPAAPKFQALQTCSGAE